MQNTVTNDNTTVAQAEGAGEKRALTVVTDSASNLTDDLLDTYGIEMISFHANVDGEDFCCWERGRDYAAASHQYYDAMRSGVMPRTALVNTQAFIELFTAILERGEDVLYIGMSAGLTGTVNAARRAAEELNERYGAQRCYVQDSVGASLGEGLLAIHAAKLARDGADAPSIMAEIAEMIPHMNHLFTVDDLVYLYRGGRISKFVKLAGGILGIKPLLRATDEGTIELYGKCRGRKKSLDTLAEQFAATALCPELQTIGIAHADCKEDAEYLRDRITALTGVGQVIVRHYDLCSGSHVGPGAIALFFQAEKR